MDNLNDYILSHSEDEPQLLQQISRDTHVNLLHADMASGHLQGRLLKLFVEMIRPMRILEVGTFTGYSALCMAEGLPEDGHLDTVEIDDELEDIIRRNLQMSSFNSKIKLHIGDISKVIDKFDDEAFDLVFLDGDKRTYWQDYERILPKLRNGGFILADNTLWHDKVLQEPASNDWQTKGILLFNDNLKRDLRVEKVILPIRDGLTIIRKL